MRVLVTGVAGHVGGEVTRRLAGRPDVEAVFGLDASEPRRDLGRTQFVHADVRHSTLSKLVRGLGVDTVVHAAVLTDGTPSGRDLHEVDVIGTMNLLAACAGAGSPVRRLVVRSGVGVYGAGPDQPSFLGEDEAGGRPPRTGLERALREMERMVLDHALRNPDATVTVLRLGRRLGIREPTTLGAYLSRPVVPIVAGYDPRLQFLHEDDAVEAFLRALDGGPAGAFNVAGQGVILLTQAIALAGGRALPVLPPFARWSGRLALAALGVELSEDLLDFLTFGPVMDCAALEAAFGWRPRHGSREAVADFVHRAGPAADRPPAPMERELEAYLQRRRRRGATG